MGACPASPPVLDFLFKAMCLHKLDRPGEAKQLLQVARRLMQDGDYASKIDCDAALEEARDLIDGKTDGNDKR